MLLHYNKGLVRQFVWRCKRMGTDCSFGELAIAGDDAMIKAALKWDPQKGTRFSTYAFLRVNRAIVAYMMEHEDVIKIPSGVKELQNKIRGAQTDLEVVIFQRPAHMSCAHPCIRKRPRQSRLYCTGKVLCSQFCQQAYTAMQGACLGSAGSVMSVSAVASLVLHLFGSLLLQLSVSLE